MSQALNVKGHSATIGDPMSLWPRKTCAAAEADGKKGHFCKPLPKEFKRNRFTYRQIVRRRNAAIYKQSWNDRSNSTPCYELIRVRRREGFEINGRFVEPAEVYPRSEAWGVDAWTFCKKDAAFAKLRALRSRP